MNLNEMFAPLPLATVNAVTDDVIPEYMPAMDQDAGLLSNEVDAITLAIETFREAELLLEDAVAAGGFSKSFAVEALRIFPGFNNNLPVGGYSELPSATQYRASMESIFTKANGLFALALGAVGLIIYKIFRWIFGGKKAADAATKPGDVKAAAKDAADTLKDNQEGMEEIPPMLDDITRLIRDVEGEIRQGELEIQGPDGKLYTIRNIDEVIDMDNLDKKHPEIRDTRKNPPAVVVDFLTDGQYSKTILDMAGSLESLSQALVLRFKQITERLSEEFKEMSKEPRAVGGPNIEARFQSHTWETPLLVSVDGKDMALIDAVAYVGTLRANIENRHKNAELTYDKIFRELPRAYRKYDIRRALGSCVQLVENLANAEKQMMEAESIAGSLDTDGQAWMQNRPFGGAMRLAIKQFSNDLRQMQILLSMILGYRDELIRFTNHAVHVVLRVGHRFWTTYRSAVPVDARAMAANKAEWERLARESERLRKKWATTIEDKFG